MKDARLEKLLKVIDSETEKLASLSEGDAPLSLDEARTVTAYVGAITGVQREQRLSTKAVIQDLSKMTKQQLDKLARQHGLDPDALEGEANDDADD